MTEPILMPFQDQPFNGDTFVQAEFLKLKEKFSIDRVIETGSCLYSTTKWLGENFESVKTIEINNQYAQRGMHKVKGMENVKAIVGISSVEWLNQVASVYESNKEIIHDFKHLFFLDAHWGDECPLLQELEAISKLRTHQLPVIVIHDFKVPNEPNLGYDSIHGQAFEFDWIKPKLEMIYGVDGYDYYYNSDATSTEVKRGVIYITPKIMRPIIICGVTDMEGNPVKKTKEEQEEFVKMMSNNGEYHVIYSETNGMLSIKHK